MLIIYIVQGSSDVFLLKCYLYCVCMYVCIEVALRADAHGIGRSNWAKGRRDILRNIPVINTVTWKPQTLLAFSNIESIDEALKVDQAFREPPSIPVCTAIYAGIFEEVR